jgi:hypothetical protein
MDGTATGPVTTTTTADGSSTGDGTGASADGTGDASGDGDATSGDGDGTSASGDGDGTSASGDGDGASGDGDGVSGDGDGTSGDGDGTSGDGDGTTTGDGDGTATGDGDGTSGDGDGDGVSEVTCAEAAQSLTSAGCLFAPIVGNDAKSLPWAVIAANTNPLSADVTLYDPNGTVIETAVVAPLGLHIFELDGAAAETWEHPEASGVQQLAFRLEATRPVVAYEFQPYSSSGNATADASLLLPEHAWDTNHLMVTAKNDGEMWMTVVSLEDNNQVTVFAADYQTGSTQGGGTIPALSAGQMHTETLNSQQTLRIFAPSADLTGMEVLSTGPVAVFGGSPGTALPGPGFQGYHDYLEEQIPPRSAWGTEHAVVKFQPRGSSDSDLYRIVADKDNTVVTLTGGYTGTFNLNQGEFAEFLTGEAFMATANDAFLIAHHITSCSNNTGPKDDTLFPGSYEATNNCSSSNDYRDMGDPAVSYIVPTDQFRSRYTFLTPDTYAWDMVSIIAPTSGWSTITLDGAPLPAPTALPGSNLSYARFQVTDGPHYAESAFVSFGLEVYGYDCRISYAYAGGLSLGTINTPPTPQ